MNRRRQDTLIASNPGRVGHCFVWTSNIGPARRGAVWSEGEEEEKKEKKEKKKNSSRFETLLRRVKIWT